MPHDAQLRSRLQQITQELISEHAELVRRLRDEFAHTIEPARDGRGQMMRPFGTCFAFAMGFHEDAVYHRIATLDSIANLEHYFASPAFVSWLLESGTLRRLERTVPLESVLVLYFKPTGEPVHAGIEFAEGRVRSKWGIGWVWDHGVWEVPSSYGHEVAYYERPTIDQTRAAFLDWLREQPDFVEFATEYDLLDLVSDCDG